MTHTTRCLVALASLAGIMACGDQRSTTAPANPAAAVTPDPAVTALQAHSEALGRWLALALGDPAFRAHVKARLDASPFREHKLQFQQFLSADGGRGLDQIARASGAGAADVAAAAAGLELEMYLPVPAHRRGWRGDANVLVATAIRDHDAPVAFDTQGHRSLLSPERPPATPVIALVPVETDFTPAASMMMACADCEGGGGGGGGGGGTADYASPTPVPGLYMTASHFVDDFEGWLKGSPEFEAHILGQKGTTDSLTDYQCAGERQAQPYYFDQNGLDWSGSVLLFSGTQIADYNAAHPGQNARVYFVEDDDTACQIKTTNDGWKWVMEVVDASNQALTAGKDTTLSTGQKAWKFAKALQKFLIVVASLINTNDELVGDAVQDSVTGEYHAGFNWIVKGANNVTNGWIKLEMK